MSKNLLLATQVIAKYHPHFARVPNRRKDLISYPNYYNISYLVEETIAKVGGHKFVNGDHYDLNDFSEIKTASIRSNPSNARCKNSYTGEVTNVSTACGTEKLGLIRLIIYNPHRNSLMYYLLPKCFWKNHITYHPTSKIGKLIFSYNDTKNCIKKFDPYRVESVLELST